MYSIHQENRCYRTSPYLLTEGLAAGFSPLSKGGLLLNEKADVGYYFLKGFDTEEDGMSFNRLKLEDNFTAGVKLDVYILVQDSPYGEYQNRVVDIEQLLQCGEDVPSPAEKLTFLIQQGAKVFSNHTDILLHGLTGRYIWIALKSYNAEEHQYCLDGLQIEYPMQTFLDYLPQVYAEGGAFLQRYIGIFQSLYLDVEETIDKLSLYLDPDTVPDKFLDYLCRWVGIDNSSEIFDKKQLRQVIKRAAFINSGKGTKTVLEELITLYAGTKPVIIEYFLWGKTVQEKEERKKLYETLYGENCSYFTVIIDMQKASKHIVKEKLKLLIEQYKPAMSNYNLVLLENCDCSDTHCYLGINSCLAKPDKACIDAKTRLTGTIML